MSTNNPVDSFDPNSSWQGLTLTDAAAKQICKLVENDTQLLGVQLLIKPSGCVGYAYALSTIAKPNNDDLIFEYQGAKLFVPISAMPYLDGTEVDYVSKGLNKMFEYRNPKVQNACGCGESFNV